MALDVRGLWTKAQPALLGLWRLVGGFALAYLFLLLLITAWLQTSVSERLANIEFSDEQRLDYSSGYALWRVAQGNRDALMKLLKEQRTLTDQVERADDDKRRALEAWQSSMESHDLLLQWLAPVRGCEFLQRESRQLSTESVLSDLRACLDQGTGLSAVQRQAAGELLNAAGAFRKIDVEYRVEENEAGALRRRLDRVSNSIALLRQRHPDRVKASGAFAELAAFTEGRLGGRNFGSLPPAVVQILLAFVSGMFGALLVTLVLVVYPKNDLKLSRGDSSIEARIFLGGLIALCVFVVLGGGTAVLGTSEGFGDGEANFLAFSAIAILAGMFSDRVAQWLSGRADAFFSREQNVQRQQPGGPKEDPPSQGGQPAPSPNDTEAG